MKSNEVEYKLQEEVLAAAVIKNLLVMFFLQNPF